MMRKNHKMVINSEKESVESLNEYNYNIPNKLAIRNESIIILTAFITLLYI